MKQLWAYEAEAKTKKGWLRVSGTVYGSSKRDAWINARWDASFRFALQGETVSAKHISIPKLEPIRKEQSA